MTDVIFREVVKHDLVRLAEIRATNSGTYDYWLTRIENYFLGLAHPQEALLPRVIYVALIDGQIIAFIAGHLTRRFNCEGELQWIDTVKEFRNKGIASQLVKILANWFIDHKAYNICVDPGNEDARKFYRKNGATDLNKHWMYWEDIRKIV